MAKHSRDIVDLPDLTQTENWMESSEDEDDTPLSFKRRKLNHHITAYPAAAAPEKPKETLPTLMAQIMNEPDCPELMTSNDIFEKVRARHRYYAEVFNQQTLKSNISVYLSQNTQFMKRGMVGPGPSCWWSLTRTYSTRPLTCVTPPQVTKPPTVPRRLKQISDISGSPIPPRANNPENLMRVDELYYVKRNCREDYEVEARHNAQAWLELPSLETISHMNENFKPGDFITIAVDAGGGKDGEEYGQIFQIRQINEFSNAVAVFWFKSMSSSLRMCNQKHKSIWRDDGLQYMITNEVGVISMHTITAKTGRVEISQLSTKKTVLDVSGVEYKVREFSEKEVAWMQNLLPRGQVQSSAGGRVNLALLQKTPKRLAGIAAATEISRSFDTAIDSAYESSPVLRRSSARTQSSHIPSSSHDAGRREFAVENVSRAPISTSKSLSLPKARLGFKDIDRRREVDSVLPETRPVAPVAVTKDKEAIISWLRKKVEGFSAKDEVELEELEMFEALTHMVANNDGPHTATNHKHHRQDPETTVSESLLDYDAQFGASTANSADKIDRLETELSEMKASLGALQAWKEDFERKMFPKSSTAAGPVRPKFGETPSDSFRKQYNLPPGVVVYANPDGTPMYRDDTRNPDGSLKYIDRCWPLKLNRAAG